MNRLTPYLNYMENNLLYEYEPTLSKKVAALLLEAVYNKKSIILDWDSDPDGLYSVCIITDILKALNYKNYHCVLPNHKRHGIDNSTIDSILNNNGELLIILDSSSDKLTTLEKLVVDMPDLKIILIDHHVIELFSEIPNVTIINNHLFKDNIYKELSCGMLTYLVFLPMLKELGTQIQEQAATLAFASLVSDSISCKSPELIRFIGYVTSLPNMHPLLSYFRAGTSYTKLSRNYLSFKVNPILNACFRMELLHLFLPFIEANGYLNLQASHILDMTKIYNDNKTITANLVSHSSPISKGDFVVADITKAAIDTKIPLQIAKNFTGMVATKLTAQSYKPIIAYINLGTMLKGSVRDKANRNLLPIVSNYINANGHLTAFGFKDTINSLNDLINSCRDISKIAKSENIYLLYEFDSWQELQKNLPNMSKVAELGFVDISVKIAIPKGVAIKTFPKVSKCDYRGISMVSFTGQVYNEIPTIWEVHDNSLWR